MCAGFCVVASSLPSLFWLVLLKTLFLCVLRMRRYTRLHITIEHAWNVEARGDLLRTGPFLPARDLRLVQPVPLGHLASPGSNWCS